MNDGASRRIQNVGPRSLNPDFPLDPDSIFNPSHIQLFLQTHDYHILMRHEMCGCLPSMAALWIISCRCAEPFPTIPQHGIGTSRHSFHAIGVESKSLMFQNWVNSRGIQCHVEKVASQTYLNSSSDFVTANSIRCKLKSCGLHNFVYVRIVNDSVAMLYVSSC